MAINFNELKKQVVKSICPEVANNIKIGRDEIDNKVLHINFMVKARSKKGDELLVVKPLEKADFFNVGSVDEEVFFLGGSALKEIYQYLEANNCLDEIKEEPLICEFKFKEIDNNKEYMAVAILNE